MMSSCVTSFFSHLPLLLLLSTSHLPKKSRADRSTAIRKRPTQLLSTSHAKAPIAVFGHFSLFHHQHDSCLADSTLALLVDGVHSFAAYTLHLPTHSPRLAASLPRTTAQPFCWHLHRQSTVRHTLYLSHYNIDLLSQHVQL